MKSMNPEQIKIMQLLDHSRLTPRQRRRAGKWCLKQEEQEVDGN